MFSLIWLKVGKWVALSGGVIAALFAVWRSGKVSGQARAEVKAEQQRTQDNEVLAVREIQRAEAENAKTVETIQVANDVNQSVNNLDDIAVHEQLHNKWQKKSP